LTGPGLSCWYALRRQSALGCVGLRQSRIGVGRAWLGLGYQCTRDRGSADQAGCREACLHTETDRLAAIALYLQLEFEPIVRSDPECEVWERVIGFLRANDP